MKKDSKQPEANTDGNLILYLLVAGALGFCTIASFFCNNLAQKGLLTDLNSFWIILALATIKAALVALIFMHLKWDGKLVFFLLFPVCILAILFIVALLPDTLFAHNLEWIESGQFGWE